MDWQATADRRDVPAATDADAELSWAGHVKSTLALGVPLIGAQLAQMAIGVTDTVMVGQLGARQLAALTLAAQTFFFFFIFGTGLAVAVMPIAAQARGRNDVRGVRRSVRMGLWVAILYSAIVMAPLWTIEPVLLLLGQQPETAALAGEYMRVAQWAMLPALAVMALRSYLSVLERAQAILWATLAGVLLNIALNYAFIFGNWGAPRLEVTGAALASVGANLCVCLLLVAWCAGRRESRRYELFTRFWRPDWPAFFEVLRLGWPIGATILAEVGLFVAASILIGRIGTVELAAHGIALQLASLSFMFPLGLASAATVRVGYACGRGDRVGLGRAGTVATGLTVAIALVFATVFWTVPQPLIGLFLDEANADADAVLRHATPLLAVAAAFQLMDGLQVTGVGLLRGLKDTRTPMILALISYWAVGMTAAWTLGFHAGLGAVGVWWGLASGLGVAAALMNWRYYRREELGLVDAAGAGPCDGPRWAHPRNRAPGAPVPDGANAPFDPPRMPNRQAGGR